MRGYYRVSKTAVCSGGQNMTFVYFKILKTIPRDLIFHLRYRVCRQDDLFRPVSKISDSGLPRPGHEANRYSKGMRLLGLKIHQSPLYASDLSLDTLLCPDKIVFIHPKTKLIQDKIFLSNKKCFGPLFQAKRVEKRHKTYGTPCRKFMFACKKDGQYFSIYLIIPHPMKRGRISQQFLSADSHQRRSK